MRNIDIFVYIAFKRCTSYITHLNNYFGRPILNYFSISYLYTHRKIFSSVNIKKR